MYVGTSVDLRQLSWQKITKKKNIELLFLSNPVPTHSRFESVAEFQCTKRPFVWHVKAIYLVSNIWRDDGCMNYCDGVKHKVRRQTPSFEGTDTIEIGVGGGGSRGLVENRAVVPIYICRCLSKVSIIFDALNANPSTR